MNLDSALVIQYQSQFETALQAKGSKLRDYVFTQDVVGESTRFDVMGKATSIKNRDIATPLAFDTDNPITNALAVMDRYESFRAVNRLQEFMAKANARQKIAEATASELGRAMDKALLDAMKASSTSLGSAGALGYGTLQVMNEKTEEYDWNTDNMTWVITPRVYSKLLGLTEYKSVDYNGNKPLAEGPQAGLKKPFMGWNIIVTNLLQTSTYWTSAASHKTYAFNSDCVGLGIAKDISTELEWSTELRAHRAIADGVWGAATIQPTGVFMVEINGL